MKRRIFQKKYRGEIVSDNRGGTQRSSTRNTKACRVKQVSLSFEEKLRSKGSSLRGTPSTGKGCQVSTLKSNETL